MATYYSDAAKNGQAPDKTDGSLLARFGQYVVPSGGLSAGDVIQMVPVPAGAQTVDVLIEWSALASGATITVNAGSDADGFYAAVVGTNKGRLSLFGGFANGAEIDEAINAEGLGYTWTAADTIDVRLGTAGAAENDVITMCHLYTMEGTFSDTEDMVSND